jgi:hypothetical protein
LTKVHDPSEAISKFGATTKKKLANKAISGAPEDQLRGPLDVLFKDIAQLTGISSGAVVLVGESALAELSTRPDYAVTVHNALIGFIEIKAPGKGADPRKFTDEHDKRQWAKLKSLPNLLYSDGNSFSLWRDDRPEGSIVRLDGDVESSGAALAAPPGLLALISCAGSRSRRAAPRSWPRSARGFILRPSFPTSTTIRESFGGRVFPLWQDAAATYSNIKAALLRHLTAILGKEIMPEDVMACLAAAMAHPALTARFKQDLIRPGLRVPLTADAELFAKAVALGREVIWLHAYGDRFADPAEGRPAAPPRLPKGQAPTIPKGGAIPGAPEPPPDTMHYDAAKRRLHIGKVYIDNVPPEVWAYEVSGMNVLRQWFSYRKRDRTRPIIGDRRPPSPLSFIQPDHWLAEYTSDLIDLLNVLGRLVLLEPKQAALLDEILAGELIDRAKLEAAGAFAYVQHPNEQTT